MEDTEETAATPLFTGQTLVLSKPPTPQGNALGIRQVTVAPVGVTVPQAPMAAVPAMSTPLGYALTNVVSHMEIFNDQQDRWIAWKADWRNYLQDLGAGQVGQRVTDGTKLSLLRKYGGESVKREILRRQDEGGDHTYASV